MIFLLLPGGRGGGGGGWVEPSSQMFTFGGRGGGRWGVVRVLCCNEFESNVTDRLLYVDVLIRSN